MKRSKNGPLENMKVASPCSQDWNSMSGDDRQRFCGLCNLNVYNLSGMSRTDAENLLVASEGRLCVRFYRRSDGTILTRDCPVGWAAVRRRISKSAAAFVSLIFGIVGGIWVNAIFKKAAWSETLGTVAFEATPKRSPKPVHTPVPENATTPRDYIMGKVSIAEKLS